MTDPADAYRELRESRKGQTVPDVGLLVDEVARLRAVIENAPHAPECEKWELQPQTGRPLTDACTCWKADAL